MKKIIIILSCILFSGLSACNDFLDTLPDNRTEIKDVDGVRDLLANAYPKASYAVMLELRCDGVKDFGADYFGSQPDEDYWPSITAFNWDEYSLNNKTDSHGYFWEQSYAGIASSNFALQKIEQYNMTGKEVDLARAEARIARAYNHFTLLSIFSNMFSVNKNTNPGIPYVEEPENEVFKQYERGTVASVLAKVEKDLFEEIDNIGDASVYKQPKFHFTTQSATAFAVRYKLFTEDYAGTIAYANRILPTPSKFLNSEKTLVDPTDYAYISLGNDLLNWPDFAELGTDTDAIGRAFTNPDATANMLFVYPPTNAMRTFIGTFATRYSYPSSYYNSLIQSGVTGSTWAVQTLVLTGNDATFFVKWYEDFKLVNPSAGIGDAYSRTMLFKLEEVLLNRAEAYAMTGQYEKAINDLNMYIQNKLNDTDPLTYGLTKSKIANYYADRAKDENNFLNNSFNKSKFPVMDITATLPEDDPGILQRAIILTILDLRRVEFLYEGTRYFDILRWHIPAYHTDTKGVRTTLQPNDPRRILQLPESTKVAGLAPNTEEHAD